MLELEKLCVRAGTFELKDISLSIPTGQCVVLMGKTGSGKTTLMEAVCGLKKVDRGAILLDKQDISHTRPGERGIGFVPQDTVLFTNMTVRKHLAFGPEIQGWPREAIEARVEELSDALQIKALLDRKPPGLSGGESKRVALGRALAARPAILCLDEPFSALDEETHHDVCQLLQEVQRSQGITTLHITHQQAEADLLADIQFRLIEGKLT